MNEVLLSFYFTVEKGTEIPLDFEFYETTSGTPQKIALTNGKTDSVELGYGPTQITKKFQLKVIWNKNNNSIDYANKKVNCTVKLQAEQVLEQN